MPPRGTRGAYRKEDRIKLPSELQKELVEKAAARYGNCQELAKALDIPKSSVHYYLIGRLTLPKSLLERMLEIAHDDDLAARVTNSSVAMDRMWSIEYAKGIYRDMCKEKLRLPTRGELEQDHELRRKAAAIVSYVLAEGSVWMNKEVWGEHAVNITFAEHEKDLYGHFRALCNEVFRYDIGPPQKPGNGAKAIRGFIYSRFVAEWLIQQGVPVGDKAETGSNLPDWVMESNDLLTWTSALQPLCDGEGCVSVSPKGIFREFTLAQSRHTDLDLDPLPMRRESVTNSRTLYLAYLRSSVVFGMPVLDYCSVLARSGLMDDAMILFKRLGFRPKFGMVSMYLKGDGLWSCKWQISISRKDRRKLLEYRLVRQDLKRYALVLATG
jgi:hypothetical protein